MILTSSHLQLDIFIGWALFLSCWVIIISFYAILLWTTKGYYGNLYSFPLFTFFEQVVSLTMWGKWHIHWDITWKSAPNCFNHSWGNVKLKFVRQSGRRRDFFLGGGGGSLPKYLPKTYFLTSWNFIFTSLSWFNFIVTTKFSKMEYKWCQQ